MGLSSAPEGRNLLCLQNAEHGALWSCNFQLIIFFFALLTGCFSGLAAYFPPSFFFAVKFLFNTTTPRPRHRCLPPLRCCHRHPLRCLPRHIASPLPPSDCCHSIAAIGPPSSCSAPPAPPPPLHLNVALDVHNLAASPQHGFFPMVRRMGFVRSVLHNHEGD